MTLLTRAGQILDKYGWDVVVLRPTKKLRCSCFSEIYREPNSNCSICYGLGWVPHLGLWKARFMPMDDEAFGSPGVYSIWYLPRESKILTGDYIIDIDWEYNYAKDIVNRYKVDASYMYKYAHNESIYIKTVCSRLKIDDYQSINILEAIRDRIQKV
jgi:hypothetical protein